MISRRQTRELHVGPVVIGGDNPVAVQSMTTTDTHDIHATLDQMHRLQVAGCDIVRVGVPHEQAARAIGELKKEVAMPIVADIHFDYKLALVALDQGVDCLRLNPGNIGRRHRVETVVTAAQERGVPIRIGVNAGSLEKDILRAHGGPTAAGMVESGLRHIRILEDLDFRDIKISLKASDPLMMMDAYRMLATQCDYPFHLGVTEAGPAFSGTVKSAIGIGALLAEGIGDTIRVSLAAAPEEEVKVGWEILKSLGLRTRGLSIIACPTCARMDFDVVKITTEIEDRLQHFDKPYTVAIMGCVVNGPGESKIADVGIAGHPRQSEIYVRGKPVRRLAEENLVDAVVEEVEKLAAAES